MSLVDARTQLCDITGRFDRELLRVALGKFGDIWPEGIIDGDTRTMQRVNADTRKITDGPASEQLAKMVAADATQKAEVAR